MGFKNLNTFKYLFIYFIEVCDDALQAPFRDPDSYRDGVKKGNDKFCYDKKSV
jgi:hypothetical protein